ncbi:hypothetical protein PISMIDRAFT_625040 [Pisolithus microcarpus 441]|uniref:Uncharacterized protein n=1 Tax=Pisolithus microcarpus 441 TaxID=765257 RepID=A0A0C9YS41_9AGAM|nr:hypothetical protein BKA83DRAFT_625040 [Pisolithus microcarpus]KIK19456.1 hypothetical protein PISMIDRAFT_625040 [Pisolithus microcarpus 441]
MGYAQVSCVTVSPLLLSVHPNPPSDRGVLSALVYNQFGRMRADREFLSKGRTHCFLCLHRREVKVLHIKRSYGAQLSPIKVNDSIAEPKAQTRSQGKWKCAPYQYIT